MENLTGEDIILKAKLKAEKQKMSKIRFYIRIILLGVFLVAVISFINFLSIDKQTIIWKGKSMLNFIFVVIGLLGPIIFGIILQNWSFPVRVKDNKYKEYIPIILAETQKELDENIEDAHENLTDLYGELKEAKKELEEAQALRIEFESLRYDRRLTSL